MNPFLPKILALIRWQKSQEKMIDKKKFFATIKSEGLFNKLSQVQVDSMSYTIDSFTDKGLTDIRWLAYMFATEYHETAATMESIGEYGKGKGRPYGTWYKNSNGVLYTFKNGRKNTFYLQRDRNILYYGRGKVQLTWYDNYELMGRLLGIDLLNHPELALDPKISTEIMIEGMTKGSSSFGDFTGKSLEVYFNSKLEDPINARRIINGLDKAQLIAGYYYKFKKALQ